ncbi:MAG: Uma2 family endonuclease [Spirulinaceae cyanobacterium SM2_1_0]|nr:Uma2 family endonuclease [Spirulinaceae cyanobacterium SM2_1_0]
MKVRLEAVNAFYYPDIAVTCDERDRRPQQHFIAYPCLMIEVLPPSTAAFARGEKFADYRTLPSLREYDLVSTEHQQVHLYRHDASGQWSRQTYREGSGVATTAC